MIQLDGHSSNRSNVEGLWLHPGDEIRIEVVADNDEHAALDPVEIQPHKR